MECLQSGVTTQSQQELTNKENQQTKMFVCLFVSL